MALKIVKVKEICQNLSSAKCVSITWDFKLISILSYNHCLNIFHVDFKHSGPTVIQNVQSYMWQSKACSGNQYQLLTVNTTNNLICYSINVQSSSSVIIEDSAEWSISSIFSSNQSLEALDRGAEVHVLKYEDKEVVLCVERRLEVTLYLSMSRKPVVVSVLEFCDEKSTPREVCIVDGKILVLNDAGNTISVFCISSNFKVFEVDLNKCSMKPDDVGCVETFAASSGINAIAVYTDKCKLFWFSLDTAAAVVTCGDALPSSAVTAFSKRFPSVKQLDDGFRSFPNANMGVLHPVSLPCDVSFSLQQITLHSSKLYFLLHCKTDTIVGVHPLDLETETVFTRVKSPVHLIKSSSEIPNSPVLLLFETNLSLLHLKFEPEEIVKELMMYPCSKAAEILSKLNGWQNIQIDIEVLRQGLYKRELDTIAFFLKAHCERMSQECCEIFTQPEKYKNEIDLWNQIISLLLDKIDHIFSDGLSDQFVENLLQIVMSTLIHLITVTEECRSKMKNLEQSCVENCVSLNALFSKFLQMSRKILRDYNNMTLPEYKLKPVYDTSSFYPDEVLKQWDMWHHKLSTQEIVEHSVIKGDIPIAISFFMKHQENILDSTSDIYDGFLKIVSEFVVNCIRVGDLPKAKTALSNMGLAVDDFFLDVFRNTLEKDIRTVLQHELHSIILANEEDKKNVEFASAIETLCPCTSFEKRKQFLQQQNSQLEVVPKCSFPNQIDATCLETGDIGPLDDSDGTGAYCRFSLKWLSEWDEETRGRIIISLAPSDSDFFSLKVSPEVLWFYMLEHGNVEFLKNWIGIWLQKIHGPSSNEMSHIYVNDSMVNAIKERAPIQVAESLLDELARNSIFCKQEQDSMPLLLRRIGRSQCRIEDIFARQGAVSSLSPQKFFHDIVHYCLRNKLHNFLFSFISQDLLRDEEKLSCSSCDVPIVRTMSSFSKWARDPSCIDSARSSVLLLTQHLNNLPDMMPETLLRKIPVSLSTALLPFLPDVIPQFLSKQNEAFQNEIPAVGSSQKHQQVLKVLGDFVKQNSKPALPDVSVYELLQGSHPIDPLHLLGWQPNNPIKNEDSPVEIPHFSSKALSKYGVKEPITFLFYLREGQPQYAYLKLLAEEQEPNISARRSKAACKQAFHLGICNYKKETISSACVSFLEILGQDSLFLRASLVLANILHNSKVRNPVGTKENLLLVQEISSLFRQAGEQHEAAQKLLVLLKDAVQSTDDASDNKSLFRDIVKWIPLMIVANAHNVDIYKDFLNSCAQKNDWFGFLLFAQIFQLPKRQVLNALPRFSDPCIEVHIRNSLEKKCGVMPDDVSLVKHKLLIDNRDTRKSFYKKIGLVKKPQRMTDDKAINDKSEEYSSVSSEDSSVFPIQNLEEMHSQKDLFGLLLFCHRTDVPWISLLYASYCYRNPVLAVFAASYPEAELLSCFATWLSTIVVSKVNHMKCQELEDPMKIASCWTVSDLEFLIINLIRENRIILLLQGIKVFLPRSPLLSLASFLVSFVVYKKFNSSSDQLKEFQQKLWDYRKSGDPSSSLCELDTLKWIEETSVLILKEVIVNFSTHFERKLMLRHLFFAKIGNSFSSGVSVPSFNKLYQLEQCLEDSEMSFNIESLLLPDTNPEYKNACWDIVKNLLASGNYNSAISFANISSLPIEDVLIMKIDHEVKTKKRDSALESLSCRIEYWKGVVSELKIFSKEPVNAVTYLMEYCENTDSFGEKYFVTKLVIESLVPKIPEFQQNELKNLQSKLWLWCVKAEEHDELSRDMMSATPTNLWEMNSLHEEVPKECCTLESAMARRQRFPQEAGGILTLIDPLQIAEGHHMETEALDRVIKYFLEEKDLLHALELSNVFDYMFHELRVILLCIKLAVGKIDLYTACSQENINIGAFPPGGKKSVLQWHKLHSKGVASEVENKTILALEILCERTAISTKLCNKIIVSYAVSLVLGKSYEDVSSERNTCILLKEVLASQFKSKVELAKKVAVVHGLLDGDIALFFSREIRNCLQATSSSTAQFGRHQFFNTSDQFQGILKLCQDPSLLGKKLFEAFDSEILQIEEFPAMDSLYQLVDMCICAHDCFTAACDMEGIYQVLHKSHSLILMLAKLQRFSLMVQLFTGISRYSEMAYVFDILEEHKQFELLFGKGMEKVPNLKLALLDYLKHHPSTKAEVFHMLAYNFQMHREIAEMLETSSKNILSQLSERNSGIGLEKELELVMQDFSNAADHYCKADCMHRAMVCAKQAQLVALQLFLLTSEPVWILNLNDSTVARFIAEHDDFPQALIVAEAYKHHCSWSQAIFHNVINKGNWEYLKQLQLQLGLSTSLIEDVAQIYECSTKTESQAKNMKKLISYCSNIEVKYRLATRSGFSDIAMELLRGDSACYLQDLIAKGCIK